MARSSASRQLLMATLGILVVLYSSLLGMRVLWPISFEDTVRQEATLREISPDLIGAVIYAESRFRPDAISPRGAVGLMQIMPETGAWIAESLGEPTPTEQDLSDAQLSVRYGTWYLAYLLERFGELDEALAAYNAGPSAVDRWLAAGSDPYPETAAFVRRVVAARPIYSFYLRFPALLQITPPLRF